MNKIDKFLDNLAHRTDTLFNKILPKKFMVIVVASYLVMLKYEVPEEYWYLLGLYFLSNTATKFSKPNSLKTMNLKDIIDKEV